MMSFNYARTMILLVFLFACSSHEKYPPIDKDYCAQVNREKVEPLSQQLTSFSDLMTSQTGVYTLEEGDESMISRAWLCESAEKTIDIKYFIFSADNIGLIAIDYLLRAADRGVQIRLLVDDIMVEADADDLLALDAHPNLSIKIYNPTANIGKNLPEKLYSLASDFRGFNQRMHNKTLLVDGKVAITGLLTVDSLKLNTKIKYEYLHQYACNPENFWPQVREKIKAVPTAIKQIEESGLLVWTDRVDFVSDLPGKNNGDHGLKGGGTTTDSLIALIRNAKESIYIQSPYLVTTE